MSYEDFSWRYDISESEYSKLVCISDEMNAVGIYGDHVPFFMSLAKQKTLHIDNVPLVTITNRVREKLRGKLMR